MILTRHAQVIWIPNEQWITNTIVSFVVTTSPNTTEMILTFLFASSSNANVRCDTKAGAWTSIRLTRASSKWIPNRTFQTFACRSLCRHYTLCTVATNISVTRCNKIVEIKYRFFFKLIFNCKKIPLDTYVTRIHQI